MNQCLTDASIEIECLKSTLVTTNEIISSNEEVIKQLEAKVAHLEAKSARLELKIVNERAVHVEQMVKPLQLQTLIDDSAKIQKEQRSDIVKLEDEVIRLRAESARLNTIHTKQSVRLDDPVDDEIPMKKRKKMRHNCAVCGYTTFKANAMKIHRQEGCRSAVKAKKISCDVCKGEFTYNTYRYHLNQYTKQSSHAKNGHQNHSPAQHRQMLENLKQTKQ